MPGDTRQNVPLIPIASAAIGYVYNVYWNFLSEKSVMSPIPLRYNAKSDGSGTSKFNRLVNSS